ncbi:MAG: DUF4339 domain-containing protein [Myxococcales bacterium]|nr:DUF4339 domain-containing protein [Myxococcales bacterium]
MSRCCVIVAAERALPCLPVTWVQAYEKDDAIRAGRIRRETLVWSAGMEVWVEAGQVPALAGHFASEPPPVP